MNDNKLKSLAPSYEGDNIDIYDEYITNALEEVLVNNPRKIEEKEKKNRNIAITGSYGSGKSTLIRTYFHKHKKYNVVYVSLGSYADKGVCDINEIEIGIIQQIIYTEDISKLKESRILRNDWTKKEKHKVYIESLLLIISIVTFVGISLISKNFNRVSNFLKNNFDFNLKAYLENDINIIKVIGIIYIILLFVFCCKITIGLISKIRFNFQPKKFSLTTGVASVEVEGKEVEKSFVMNKYIDELIYFFKNTKYRIVVFEDLDRLKSKHELFTKLKEINMVTNNSLKGDTVQFIYAAKDDIFDDGEERTKFFDIIIPIVPYSSSGNVKDLLQDILQKELKFDKWKNIANDLCTYIDNVRVLYDIENEYKVYLNSLEDNSKEKEERVDDDNRKQLLYLCAYKVIYPTKFAQLERGKGRMAYYFSTIFEKNFLDNYIKELEHDTVGQEGKTLVNAQTSNIKRFNPNEFYKNNLNKKVEYLSTCTLPKEFISNNSNENSLNNFEKHMLFADVLKPNCTRLIGLKHNLSLTVKDENTYIAIREDKILADAITIDNADKLIDTLSEEDFSRDSICIEDILIFVLKNEGYENHIRYFFANFTDIKINALFSILDKYNELFKNIVDYVNDIWNLIASAEKYRDLATLLTIKYCDAEKISDDSYFYIYISDSTSALKILNENFKDISNKLTEFDFEFGNNVIFDEKCKDIIGWAYRNHRFSWTINHIDNIAKTMNYTINKSKVISSVKSSIDKAMYMLMIQDKIKVIDMLCKETENQEDEEADIIAFIKSSNLTDDYLEKLLKIESVKFKDIKEVGHYELLQELDKIDTNFENLNTLFESNNNEISDYIRESVENNIDKLLQENVKYEQFKSLFDELLIKVDIDVFKKLINTFLINECFQCYQEDFTVEKNKYLIDKCLCYSGNKDDIEATLNESELDEDYKVKYLENCLEKIGWKNLKDLDFNENELELFSKINNNYQSLINFLLNYIDTFNESIYNRIFEICLNNKVKIADSNNLIKIMENTDNQGSDKLKFFLKYSNQLKRNVAELLSLFGEPYSSLLNNNRIRSIDNTKDNKKLANILKEEKLISSIDENDKKIRLYFKEKELINA